jgi:hypothetical protein
MTVEHETGLPPTGSASGEQSKPARVADQASSEASNVASTAAGGAREVAGEVTTQTKAVASQAKQQLDGLVGQARGEVRQQAQQRNDQAAGQLRTLSEQLVALTEGRPEQAGPLVGYLQDAQDQVRSLASRLEQRGPQGVLDDMTRLARRRPGMFLAAAAGVGFVVGRVVRAGVASQQDGSESSVGTDGRPMLASMPGEVVYPLSGDVPTHVESSTYGNGPTVVETTTLPPPVVDPDPGIRP